MLLWGKQVVLRGREPGIYRFEGASPSKQLSGMMGAQDLKEENLLELSSILLILDSQGSRTGHSFQAAQRTWKPRHQSSD